MTSPDELENLAQSISSAAKLISAYNASVADGTDRAFEEANDTVSSLPDEIRAAKNTLIAASVAIQQLVTGPAEYQQHMSISYQHLACLRWLLRFDIPSRVPLAGLISYKDVASEARVPEGQLRRVTRMAMTSGLFCESGADKISHNALSAQLRTNVNFADSMRFMTSFAAPISAKLTDATEKWGSSEAKNETAFNIAMDTEVPFFGYLSKNPAIAKLLGSGMKLVGASEETHVRHLVHGFDWASLGVAKVIDVGGSTGHASIALAKAFPHLSFTVQDLPGVIDRAHAATKASPLPEAIASRLTFEAHDFLQLQPPSSRDAAVFLLRLVLHNWPSADARLILSNILPVMGPSSRLVLMHSILPMPGTVSVREEALERMRDIFMLEAMNGEERDLSQWRQLLGDVDPRLEIVSVRKPPGSSLSVIEVGFGSGAVLKANGS